MIAFLKGLVLLPVALVVILLAIANRAPVAFSLDPFTKGAPDLAVTLPLYAIVLASVAIGVVIGGMAAWLSGGRGRRASRATRREASRLRHEADRLRAAVANSGQAALPSPRSHA